MVAENRSNQFEMEISWIISDDKTGFFLIKLTFDCKRIDSVEGKQSELSQRCSSLDKIAQ